VRKVLTLAVTSAVCVVLSSCSEPPSLSSAATSRMDYEPPTRIERAPLPPPVGYASPATESPRAVARSGYSRNHSDAEASTAGKWRSSPRWAAIKGQECIVVEQHAHSKFAKADNAEVQNCSKEDLAAGQEVSASESPAEKQAPRHPEPSESDDSSPAPPTSEDRSDGAIESWTGAI
jgi:hypothetical protein